MSTEGSASGKSVSFVTYKGKGRAIAVEDNHSLYHNSSGQQQQRPSSNNNHGVHLQHPQNAGPGPYGSLSMTGHPQGPHRHPQHMQHHQQQPYHLQQQQKRQTPYGAYAMHPNPYHHQQQELQQPHQMGHAAGPTSPLPGHAFSDSISQASSGSVPGLSAPMFSPPRLGGTGQSGPTSNSPRHGKHQNEVAASMYAATPHAGTSTHHSPKEDAAAAALLSVAGGARVDPPQSSVHPSTLPALVSPSATGAGTGRSGTLPSARSVNGISASYANAPTLPGSMSGVETSRHHSGMQPPALPSISTGPNLASSLRTTSVEPGSSPVISTSATFGGGAAAPPKKTLKLKSKPLPSSAAKVSYAVGPPPLVTTPTESLANSLSASAKGGGSSKRKKGKDEHDTSISGATGASSSGWDSDLESEANKALYKHPMLLYVDSVRARRAFLVDADRLHASARSDASWARLAGAYGKRRTYVLEGVRKRADESKDGEIAGPSSARMEAKGSAGSLNRSAKKAEAASASPVAGAADAGKKKSGKKAAKPSADEDVSMALLSTLGGEDDDEDDEDEEMEEDGPDGDLELDLLLAATGKSKSKKSSKKDDDDTGAELADSSSAVKKAKAPRKSRSKAAVASAAKEAREYAIANGLSLPPTPPPMNAPPRERGSKKSSEKDAARRERDAAATAGARLSAPPPSSPVAGSIAGLDESLANELLSTAVGGDGSDVDEDQNADEDEDDEDDDDGEDDEDELEGSDAEERAILAAKRKKLAAAVMSSGKGKGKALVPSSAAQSSASSSSGGKKRKRDLIDRHNLTGSASRAGSAAIAAALAVDEAQQTLPTPTLTGMERLRRFLEASRTTQLDAIRRDVAGRPGLPSYASPSASGASFELLRTVYGQGVTRAQGSAGKDIDDECLV